MSFKLETSLEYNMERAWCCEALKEASIVALGYDEGTVVLKLGSDYPLADFSNAKVIAAKSSQIFSYNLKLLQPEALTNGEKVPATFKELGNADMYLQGIRFNNNGQLFAVFGESDYAIYTSRGFKSIGYGTGNDLVWGKGDMFAVKLDSAVKVVKGGQELSTFKVGYWFDTIFGGDFLAVKSEDSVTFFDWESQAVIRRIEAAPKSVYWNEDGTRVALALDEGTYILKCNREAIAEYLAQPGMHNEEGVEEAFELETELPEIVFLLFYSSQIESAIWIDNALVYVNTDLKLSYFLGKKPSVLARLQKKMLLLGYVPGQNRVFLIDKSLTLVSYELLQSVIKYQEYILGKDFDTAEKLLQDVPKEAHLKLAKFLETNDYKELAYNVTPDPTHKLDLAIELGRLDAALELARDSGKVASWKQVGDLALSIGHFDVAEQCFQEAKDISSLFLLYTATSNREGLKQLQEMSAKGGEANLAFLSSFLLVLQNNVNHIRTIRTSAQNAWWNLRRSRRLHSSHHHTLHPSSHPYLSSGIR
eukprot:TRINITY_DN3091_c0_g1_i1.p1 TRINITY_DN3091_c0_g1~~TRINITY_DN3091_c0_g1_i1.p1  ORF type:complete len:534 (+),score=55.08 TRINITY_DN3091_c0_g1_i1:1008-2609(+)